jgi:hypothetical protein
MKLKWEFVDNTARLNLRGMCMATGGESSDGPWFGTVRMAGGADNVIQGQKSGEAWAEAAELWLAEHALAPLMPLRSLLPVPEGCVRVRAAVAMCGPDGWDVYGDSDEDDAAIEGGTSAWIDGWRLAGYITADVPIPTTPEIQAEVE